MNPKITYYKNGNKEREEYFNDLNQLHNEVGPADIYYYPNGNKYYEEYCINGELHNIKGPAVIEYYSNNEIESKEYFLNGEEVSVYSDEEFQKYIKRLNIS